MDTLNDIYSRQDNIDLVDYKFAIILGVGGIGSWVAFNLALSGQIKSLLLIDPDIIESSNLNRTPFRFCDIGYPKVEALKYIILERRVIDIVTYKCKTNKDLCDEIRRKIGIQSTSNMIQHDVVIIDCRDDVFDDFYEIPVKYYKIGYDGLSVTIDGNPRNTAVWGRANGYRFTPSFICPSQLAANIVVTDILTMKDIEHDSDEIHDMVDTVDNKNPFDTLGRLNKTITFDCRDILEMIYQREGN